MGFKNVTDKQEKGVIPQQNVQKGLSQKSKDLIGIYAPITVLALVVIVGLGLASWSVATSAGFTPEWTRWLTLGVGLITGLPAFYVLLIIGLIASPHPGYHNLDHHSYDYYGHDHY